MGARPYGEAGSVLAPEALERSEWMQPHGGGLRRARPGWASWQSRTCLVAQHRASRRRAPQRLPTAPMAPSYWSKVLWTKPFRLFVGEVKKRASPPGGREQG